MISDDLDVKTLGEDEGIVWRTDGTAVCRVSARSVMPARSSDVAMTELVERLARAAAEHWGDVQTSLLDRYEVAIRLKNGWAGPVRITTSRAAAVVKTVQHERHRMLASGRLELELDEVWKLRREG